MNAGRCFGVASLLAMAACAPSAPFAATPARGQGAWPPSSKIAHVVIIFQENRTTDNLFNGLTGADTVRVGRNSAGKKVRLARIGLTAPYDLDHSHSAFVTEYDAGKLDGFDRVGSSCRSVAVCIPSHHRAYGYVPNETVKPYFVMAETYAFGDRMFQTNQGPSFPAHQYIVSGTSTVADGSKLRAAENPFHPTGTSSGGCDSPSGSLVSVIDAAGNEDARAFPCFRRLSLMQLLDEGSHTWRYYQGTPGPGLWNGPDAVLQIFKNRGYDAHVVTPPTQILKDVASGKLADVVWVTPTEFASDHALETNGSGPSWVAAVVNAIGESPYWKDTAIFVTWDDWGGWYDHVKPPSYNSYELGFRVPLIVVSPYAKAHYVSHDQHEFGSILKFVEKTFGLPSLHTTDVRADDLLDCFDFSQKPRTFKRIPAKYPPSYFFNQPSTEPNDS
jgi:phospholipase C